MRTLCVGYLADATAALPVLASAFRDESPVYFRDWSVDEVIARLLEPACQRAALPMALVALDGDTVAGTVALRPDSITTHPHLGPWLAALLVMPAYRRRGIGSMLIRATEREAARLGIPLLYAGTAAVPLFTRLGWETIEHVTYCGSPLAIVRRHVSPGASASGPHR